MLVTRAEALRADPARQLRSACIAFIGPVSPGAATLDDTVLRVGSSTTQAQVTLVQDGEPGAVLPASFGKDRPSNITVDAARLNPRPPLPSPSELEPLAYVPGETPDFGGWMRFVEPPPTFGERELVTLVDAWPAAILPMFDRPASASTLAWTFEPVAWPAQGEP